MTRLALGVTVMLAAALGACSQRTDQLNAPVSVAPLLGQTGAPPTTRNDLERTVAQQRARLAAAPDDARAAVILADALLRQTRVTGNGGLAIEAERVLTTVLARHVDDYGARRMLAGVLLAQHRFPDALTAVAKCHAIRTDDAWVWGAKGDAHVELGDYGLAFDAFDRMVAIKPDAASYARVSYARELSGDLPEALRLMQMAAGAVSPSDPEALAWHRAQLGHLHFELGQLDAAQREYDHADYVFAGHPFASEGRARVAAARGNNSGALSIIRGRLASMPTPSDLAMAGDLLNALGETASAEQHYRLAEAAWQADSPEPARLARFLAERDRNIPDALRLAEAAARERRDIFTLDALAWARFRSGNAPGAAEAMSQALRTGSRDRTLRYHAAAIANATGNLRAAEQHLAIALDGPARFDPIAGPAAVSLRASLRPASRPAP